MSISTLLKEKIEKKLEKWSAELEAAEVKARAREARAESEVADAQLEKEILGRIGDLKYKIAEGRGYLEDLLAEGDDKAKELEKKLRSLDD